MIQQLWSMMNNVLNKEKATQIELFRVFCNIFGPEFNLTEFD